MPNSNGEESEKTKLQGEAKKPVQGKRKRNRNRKKNAAKVENLVSKTFQAKLVADSSQSENSIENQHSVKTNIVQTKPKQGVKEVPSSVIQLELPTKNKSPIKTTCKRDPKSSTLTKETSTPKSNKDHNPLEHNLANTTMVHPTDASVSSSEKSREDILAEREAKKLAKQQAKKKNKDLSANSIPESSLSKPILSEDSAISTINVNNLRNGDPSDKKSHEINCERETAKGVNSASSSKTLPTEKLANIIISDIPDDAAGKIKDKKSVLTKAERRAIQEAQRAAKAETGGKKPTAKSVNEPPKEKKAATLPKETAVGRAEKSPLAKSSKDCKVKLFNHLESCRKDSNLFVNSQHIHPIIVRLGEQYAKRTIVGSNARCISFLSALKMVIKDYETPAKKEFARSLETTIKNAVDHLNKCRPLAVSVSNAYKHIKHVLTQLQADKPESELKEHLCRFVDTYIENQIGKAAEAISSSVQDKISNGDVILTFGCSSLINYIFEEANRRHVKFSVVVVDSRPFLEGQELLRRLTAKEIPCTYVLINAVGFVMPEVTKILLGAHALLSNGYVMARTGTAQVALVARSFNVPVLVCCETHKFSERFQTDAIVYNELGNPDDLIMNDTCRLRNWQSQNKLSPLNLNYDITPPELVTAVVTEVAILPCTSVPVILRIKPTEIGY